MVSHFPTPLVAPPLHTSLHHGCLFLVGCCVSDIHRRPYKAMTYFCIFIFSTLNSTPQTMGRRHPHKFRPGSTSSRISPSSLLWSFGWLLCRMIKRKAQTPPLSLFFEGLHFGAPNKGANNGESATNTTSLVWAHRKQRHQDLGPWQILPWRERAKAAEG